MFSQIREENLHRMTTVSGAALRRKTVVGSGFAGLPAAVMLIIALWAMSPPVWGGIPILVLAGSLVLACGLMAASRTKMKRDNDTASMNWGQLSARGISTLSGKVMAGEAVNHVPTLPVLILGWGLAVAAAVILT